MPKVSIIIVNWNSLAYLRECLTSLQESARSAECEIIVVDNASAVDETLAIQAEFPSVLAIRSERNLGFGGANNLGYEHATAPYLLFLNPDTSVLGPAVDVMLDQLQRTAGGGIMGCKLLNTDGSVQTSCIQRFPTILNQVLDIEFLRTRWPLWKIWGIAPLFREDRSVASVEVVSGACLMISRAAFEQVGNFCEDYFMYAEDVDLCYQTRRAGWRVCYTGKASVVHHGGGTSKARKGNAWVAIMQRQAILRFCYKAHGRAYAMAYRAAMGCNAACRLILLALMSPFRKVAAERLIFSPASKWLSVLKWATGLDRSAAEVKGNA